MPSDGSDVLQQIDTFVRSRFDVPQDDPDFTVDVHLFDYGYIDSFGAHQLIEHLESTYDIKITDQDLATHRLNTLHEISEFVVGRQAGVR